MQNILHPHKSWYDPVPAKNRAIALIVAVVVVESIAISLRHSIHASASIYFLGVVRALDILILVYFWPNYSNKNKLRKTAVESMVMTLIIAAGGLIILTMFKNLLDLSFFKPNEQISGQEWPLIVSFFMTACVLSPVAEELIFRGIIYRKLRESWKPFISIPLISLVFSSVHLGFGGQFFFPFIGSVVFCIGYEKTKVILAPILLHVTGNTIIYFGPFLGII